MPKQLFNALTALTIKNAKPGRIADGGGLYLLVKPSGARSWIFRATVAGKVRDVGLGSASGARAITLAEARVDHVLVEDSGAEIFGAVVEHFFAEKPCGTAVMHH